MRRVLRLLAVLATVCGCALMPSSLFADNSRHTFPASYSLGFSWLDPGFHRLGMNFAFGDCGNPPNFAVECPSSVNFLVARAGAVVATGKEVDNIPFAMAITHVPHGLKRGDRFQAFVNGTKVIDYLYTGTPTINPFRCTYLPTGNVVGRARVTGLTGPYDVNWNPGSTPTHFAKRRGHYQANFSFYKQPKDPRYSDRGIELAAGLETHALDGIPLRVLFTIDRSCSNPPPRADSRLS